jgi:hypothetical protein
MASAPPPPAGSYVIEPNADDEMAVCSCCVGAPGLRGSIRLAGETLAIYFGDPAGMPNFPLLRLGLVVGPWRDETRPDERVAIVLTCRPPRTAGGEAEIVAADPYLPGFQEFPFLGVPLPAAQAQAHADAPLWVALTRAVIADDPRLAEIRKAAASDEKTQRSHVRRVASGVEASQSRK